MVGASGKLGSVLSKKFSESGYLVKGLDRTESSANFFAKFICANVSEPQSLEKLKDLDFEAILFAAPAAESLNIIKNLIVPFGANCPTVDFFSEKAAFLAMLSDFHRTDFHIGIHPLFAPSINWEKQNVIVTPREVHHPVSLELIRQIKNWGSKIYFCDADEHDKLMNVVQVGVHAAVIAYASFLNSQNINFEILNAISTPPARMMLAMIARMIANNPSVY